MLWMGKTSTLAEPSNTSWPCPRDRASNLRALGPLSPSLMLDIEARGPGVFALIKGRAHPDEKQNQHGSPWVAFPADILWAKPKGML